MKPKISKRKLKLTKTTISHLNDWEMKNVEGGGATTVGLTCSCDTAITHCDCSRPC